MLLWIATAFAQVPDELEGIWESTGTASIEAGIDEVVSQMPFWKRPFAKAQLRDVTEPCSELVIEELGGALSITCDDKPPAIQVPGSGPGEYVDEDGDVFGLEMTVQDDRIVQVFSRDDGSRTNVYERRGDTLAIDVVVTSPRLPDDVTYTHVFARAEPAPTALLRAQRGVHR